MTYDPPKFKFETAVITDSTYEGIINLMGKCFGTSGLIPCCMCCPNPYVAIEQGEYAVFGHPQDGVDDYLCITCTIGLISRFGKFYKVVDPGLVRVNPLSETVTTIDVRIQIQPIVRIPIVTQDNVNIIMDAVLYWCISDPYLATFGVVDVKTALIERAQTTLRAVLGAHELQDIIENRVIIANSIRDTIDIPAKAWGANVESVLFKDLTFSPELQESLSSAATQKRIGESKVIAARAEVDAARLMRQAAELLNTPSAMQIKYLEAMQQMAKGPNNKLLFVPMQTTNPPYSSQSQGEEGDGQGSSGGGYPLKPGPATPAGNTDCGESLSRNGPSSQAQQINGQEENLHPAVHQAALYNQISNM
ncbi:hypothetical protein BJ085DRAFT_29840 [Dimargaris cristalligena]|uniref:Band 7 domain-containing protein n=1 Tax=Dimargaris cristalligena TaxID=215637 RepID=A0A4Q0A1X3_9FUNG|nr:hypothetical protein BJ085DRAFT_29840 [Dimargaris cristalligena]|eukprot:RKP40126.1 hypothetical protein BJ085DRAFT_29840 [Dimargaris cristalligena]